MSIIFTIQTALRAMRANKARTGLTVLGMVIGVSAIIIVFSAGDGIKSLVLNQIELFGTDIVETEIKVPSSKNGNAAERQSAAAIVQGVQVTTLNLRDMADIDKLPNIEKSYAGILSQEQVSYGNETRKAMLMGVNAAFIDIDKSEIDYGRFFSKADDKSLSLVVVLGLKMKEKLFGDSDPLGQSIKIRKSKYRVIGVMKERGAVMSFDFDDLIYIPVRTLQKRIMGVSYISFMMHKVKDMSAVDDTAEEMRLILRENHDIISDITPTGEADTNKDDFRVFPMTEAMETISTVTGAITLLLLAIVAISLIVGGVGIMNIMYVIVSERTSEIGLRKALGARQKDILAQFLVEAVLITMLGVIIGIIFGVLVSMLIAWGAGQAGWAWKLSIPLRSFIVALGFSGIFGIAFGVYPARKAAKMDPIEALRTE